MCSSRRRECKMLGLQCLWPVGRWNYTTNSFSPITISGFTGTSQAISLTAGWTFTCALIEDGSVKCWGRNQNGQLGLGTSGAPSTTPTQSTSFGSGLYAVDVDAGWAQTCAVINDGRVMCWGQGSNGRLVRE